MISSIYAEDFEPFQDSSGFSEKLPKKSRSSTLMPICFANNAVLLKDVKAWLIPNADHWKDKTVIGLK